MPSSHSTEKEKNIRHIGHCSSSYSMKKIQVGTHLLLVELCERFTSFEVVCNMIPFCTTRLGFHNYQAAILNLCFIRTSIITPVFVGWFADVCLGRKKLIYMCLLLHFLGTALLSVVAFPLGDFYIGSHHMINNITKKEKSRLFYVALLTTCLGTGGIRAIVCPLGAYSLQEHGSQKQMSFFNWFYWIMNLNAIVLLGISYIQHSGAWALVLLIPFMSTLMALIILHMVHYNLIYQPEKCSFRTLPADHELRPRLGWISLPIAVMNVINTLPLLILAPCMEHLRTCLFPAKRDGSFLLACIISIIYRFVPSTIRGNLTNFLTLFGGFGCFMGALLVDLVYLISEDIVF